MTAEPVVNPAAEAEEVIPKEKFRHVGIDEAKMQAVVRPRTTYWQDAWRRLKQNKVATAGLILLVLVIIMAIVGPIVSWAVYQALKKAGAKPAVAVFCAAALGDLLTYVTTSFQLGVVYGNVAEYLTIFAVTQIPLAIAEGLLTVVVFNVLEKYSAAELRELSVL